MENVFGSTHVIEQLLFSIVPSILTFDFELILGSFLTILGPNGLFLELGYDSKTVLRSTYIVEKLSFHMFSSILTFDFDSILGSFFYFLGPLQAIFGDGEGLKHCFGDYSCS